MAEKTLEDFGTPFGAFKTAEQTVLFGLDPSFGLTRERYHWYSNETLFGNSFFSDGEGEIDIQTGSNGSDTARIRSAFAGQYVSQSLAKPGLKLYVDDSDVEIDDDGYVSMTHGKVYYGAFIHDGTEIQTGFGVGIDTDGAFAFWKSNGVHKGESPVYQPEWDEDELNGKGNSSLRYTPANGHVLNLPYTWYNNGKLGLAMLDSVKDKLIPFHSFDPPRDSDGRASLSTPNLPVQALLDNDGDAEPITAAVGGMQFTLFGASSNEEVRATYKIIRNYSVGVETTPPVDPISNPGEPLYAIRREQNDKTLQMKLGAVEVEPADDIYIYVWDVYDDAAALTGASFEDPITNHEEETQAEIDVSATAFDNTNAIFRTVIPVDGGKNKEVDFIDVDVEERMPIGVTRVVTAIGKTTSPVSVDYVPKILEGF